MFFPIVHSQSVVDIKSKEFTTQFINLLTKDDRRLQLKIQFKVSVSATSEDILMVAQTFGAQNTFDVEALRSFFEPQFIEAVKTTSPQFTIEEIEKNLAKFKEQILMVIGTDLNGYYLDDCAIYEISEA